MLVAQKIVGITRPNLDWIIFEISNFFPLSLREFCRSSKQSPKFKFTKIIAIPNLIEFLNLQIRIVITRPLAIASNSPNGDFSQ